LSFTPRGSFIVTEFDSLHGNDKYRRLGLVEFEAKA
jgi:hypothetical protein